jgi:hypothetical protein
MQGLYAGHILDHVVAAYVARTSKATDKPDPADAGLPGANVELTASAGRDTVMGIYLRPSRLLGVRMTKCGLRHAIGPLAARLHVGADGTGVSTGASPVTLDKGTKRKKPAKTRQYRPIPQERINELQRKHFGSAGAS